MSKYAVTIGVPHSGGKPVVVTGPEVPVGEQREALRALRGKRVHAKYAELVVLYSGAGGMVWRARFLSAAEVKRRAEAAVAEAVELGADAADDPAEGARESPGADEEAE